MNNVRIPVEPAADEKGRCMDCIYFESRHESDGYDWIDAYYQPIKTKKQQHK